MTNRIRLLALAAAVLVAGCSTTDQGTAAPPNPALTVLATGPAASPSVARPSSAAPAPALTAPALTSPSTVAPVRPPSSPVSPTATSTPAASPNSIASPIPDPTTVGTAPPDGAPSTSPTTGSSAVDTRPSGTPAPSSSPAVPVTWPDVGLADVNRTGCVSEHRPVILLPGTFSDLPRNYSTMAPELAAAGYCVYGLDFGLRATVAVRTSARATADFVTQVVNATGSPQVDVVGYSQGGLALRTALRENGIADLVHTAALIAPSFHGSTSALLEYAPAGLCPACADQRADSALLTDLNAGGDLDGSVRYTVVSSRLDDVVTPYASQAPQGPADRVSAVVIQDHCPDNRTPHGSLPHDRSVIGWVLQSLQSDGLPDPAQFSC